MAPRTAGVARSGPGHTVVCPLTLVVNNTSRFLALLIVRATGHPTPKDGLTQTPPVPGYGTGVIFLSLR